MRREKWGEKKWDTKWVKEKRRARKVWQEKWGVKSKVRKVGHKVESEKWGEKSGARNVRCDKSGEKRKVGQDKSEAREKWGEKSLGIDKIGTRKVVQREK